MFSTRGSIAAWTSLLMLATVGEASAQILIPTRPHDTLDLELKSLRDDITFYFGDPQELLLMNVRPRLTTQPRVNYSGQSNAVLQILDQELFAGGDTREKPPENEGDKDAPYGQKWEVRLSPTGPTSFSLQCEQGTSSFDFTDFEVQRIDLSADGSNLDIGFRDPNPIALERCSITTKGGSLQLSGLINARAKDVVLFVPQTECQLEVTGKSFDGESAITLQGPPASLEMIVSKKVGVRIAGPAATIARFAASHMVQDGDALVSREFDQAKCRMRLTFAEEVPRLAVQWK